MAQPSPTRSSQAAGLLARRAAACALTGLFLLCATTSPAQSTAQSATFEIAAAAAPAPAPTGYASPVSLASVPADASLTGPLHTLTASFEPAPNEEYTMDDGDQIHIDVAGRPELSLDYTIGPDGRITIATVGSVLLSGLNRQQAAEAVEHAMAPFYSEPLVTVGVIHYISNHILLLGAVQRPGLLTFDSPPTLLQVLSRGGVGANSAQMNDAGNTATAYTNNTAVGYSMPDRAFIYRGSQELAVVDLRHLLSGGAFADLRLRRNDIVLIPVENELVSVLGAVKTPGAIHFNQTATLQVLLAQAGGLSEQAGTNPLIQVINTSNGTSTQIRFSQLLDPRHGNDVSLHPGDVIFVPSTAFSKFAYVVDKISPILTVMAFTYLAAP
jgi:polysaccharide export outer membrane protein